VKATPGSAAAPDPAPAPVARSAPAARVPGGGKKPRHPWFRENLEAITVAIIMALVIRQYCVEAFKIPTGSMAPTLLGGDASLFSSDDAGGGRSEPVGDRILVNKFVYLLREPARWDVIVFKYPLNNTRNFIKRLVGLPGETLEIRDGDIYVNGALERKPRWLQESLWRNWPIWTQGESGPFLERFTPAE
jgi:signal peptidase I